MYNPGSNQPTNAGVRVTFFQRKPQPAYFSIERIFSDVRRALAGSIDATVAVSRYPSRGILGRLYNICEAAFRQGEVNHVTGDVHFLALLLRKKRTVLTIHDLGAVHRLNGIRRKIFIIFWLRLPIRRSAIVTVISQATRRELLKFARVDPHKILVIYDCVSGEFQPAPKVFDPGKPVILQVGTAPHKNLERVAEALRGIPCCLRVIGRPDERQTGLLEQCGIDYSAAADIPDKSMAAEYRRCDMLVFASTYEGFGLPIVEAQATGRPVVTGGLAPMSEVAGKSACLVDPFDPASIRQGILKIINDDDYRGELVRRGLANVERFKAENIAARYLDIYQRIVDRNETRL